MPDSISSLGEFSDEAAMMTSRRPMHLDLAAALDLDADGAALFNHDLARKARISVQLSCFSAGRR